MLKVMLKFWRTHPLFRLLASRALGGFAISAAAVGVLVVTSPAPVRRLLEHAPPALALLWFFLGLTFASVMMGSAVMELRQGEQRDMKIEDEG